MAEAEGEGEAVHGGVDELLDEGAAGEVQEACGGGGAGG